MVKILDFEKAKDYVLERLGNELSPHLTYHCLEHTRDEVVPAADRLAGLEKVGEEEHLLLLTGAYFHDLGFIRQRQDHESISIQFAEQALPEFGYTKAHIAVIRGIIQATCLPQSPTTILEKIMADADMDDLGHENFWERSNDLRQEFSYFGTSFTDIDWYTYQLRLMKAHGYFTESEKLLRNAAKQEHMLELARLLEQAYQRE